MKKAANFWSSFAGLMLAVVPQVVSAHSARDATMEKALVGYWTVPEDATDPIDQKWMSIGHNAVVHYRADGTGHVIGYLDQTCSKTFHSTDIKWSVEDGILKTTYPDGQTDSDKLLSVSASSYEFVDGEWTPPPEGPTTRTPRRVRAKCGIGDNR